MSELAILFDECAMLQTVGALDSSAKTIHIQANRWWLQTAKNEGDQV